MGFFTWMVEHQPGVKSQIRTLPTSLSNRPLHWQSSHKKGIWEEAAIPQLFWVLNSAPYVFMGCECRNKSTVCTEHVAWHRLGLPEGLARVRTEDSSFGFFYKLTLSGILLKILLAFQSQAHIPRVNGTCSPCA